MPSAKNFWSPHLPSKVPCLISISCLLLADIPCKSISSWLFSDIRTMSIDVNNEKTIMKLLIWEETYWEGNQGLIHVEGEYEAFHVCLCWGRREVLWPVIFMVSPNGGEGRGQFCLPHHSSHHMITLSYDHASLSKHSCVYILLGWFFS